MYSLCDHYGERRCFRLHTTSTIAFYFNDDVWLHINEYEGRIVFVNMDNGIVTSFVPGEGIYKFKPHVAFDDDEKAALFKLTYL